MIKNKKQYSQKIRVLNLNRDNVVLEFFSKDHLLKFSELVLEEFESRNENRKELVHRLIKRPKGSYRIPKSIFNYKNKIWSLGLFYQSHRIKAISKSLYADGEKWSNPEVIKSENPLLLNLFTEINKPDDISRERILTVLYHAGISSHVNYPEDDFSFKWRISHHSLVRSKPLSQLAISIEEELVNEQENRIELDDEFQGDEGVLDQIRNEIFDLRKKVLDSMGDGNKYCHGVKFKTRLGDLSSVDGSGWSEYPRWKQPPISLLNALERGIYHAIYIEGGDLPAVKKCKEQSCGRFFTPKNPRQEFCNIGFSRTCRDRYYNSLRG